MIWNYLHNEMKFIVINKNKSFVKIVFFFHI